METTSKIPFRRKLADHLEKMYNKYKYYECMPENDEGYETIDPDGYLNIADSIIPMVKGEYKSKQTTSQQQTIERLREALQNVTSSLIAHIGRERAKEWLEVQQAEELLNTTEPIDQ